MYKGVIVVCESWYILGDVMVDVLRVPIIFEVLMVGVDCNGVLGAYE